jgi:hypothetical protein
MKPHLFPHTYLPVAIFKKIVSIFGPVKLYQPWQMSSSNRSDNTDLEMINPPENLKPRSGIKAMLSNYRQWTDQHRDKEIREFLRFSEKTNTNDGSTWEIRQLLKTSADSAVPEKTEEIILKWHILLHLAHEVEKQDFEVKDMMKTLKGKGAILAGALQDAGETKNLMDDMSGTSASDIQDSINVGLVLASWFGLFGGYLKKNDVLITANCRVLDYITAQWNDEPSGTAKPETVSFSLPARFWSGPPSSDDKTITKMRELISNFGKDPIRSVKGLKELTGDVQKSSDEVSCISLKYFPDQEELINGHDSILKDILGKTIIFLPE